MVLDESEGGRGESGKEGIWQQMGKTQGHMAGGEWDEMYTVYGIRGRNGE